MEAIGRNTMQISFHSDTTAITITSDLTRLFSLIVKEQSSLMDYGGVMNSILPVWTVRFATIAQSSFSSLAVDSTVWNCSSSRSGFTNCDASWLAIIVKERDCVSLIPLNRFSCCKKRVWDDMLLDDCFRVVNYPKLSSIQSRMFIPSSKAIYRLSDRFRWEDGAYMKLHCFNSLVKMSRVLDNSR